jgi:hypothetical protein
MSIYKKLHKIQSQVMGLSRDAKGNNFTYVSGTKVFDHIKPLMNELGLLLKHEVISIDNERMDYRTGVGTNYEKPKSEILSKVMMRFTWIDTETGEKDENLFGANGQNDWDKGVGSALTYAERYFVLKYFHIATDEDDIDAPKSTTEPKQKAAAPQPAAATELIELKKGSDNWNAVVKYVTDNKALGLESIVNQLTRKYKISPVLQKEIAAIINS